MPTSFPYPPFPALGLLPPGCGIIDLPITGDGIFKVGDGQVQRIVATGDRKVEFVSFPDHSLAHVRSALGYPAYYPVPEARLDKPVQAVLMDLDGTSVHSEEFWIWIIELTTASLVGDTSFRLSPDDIPFVSGHSVSEHLQHCINRYAADRTVEQARQLYFEHTRREMKAILEGCGRPGAFVPAPGLKEFLLALKSRNIRIGLVTSGLYEKAWPEIVSAFQTLELGAPEKFYDAIITAGFPLAPGHAGTLGELSPKPHPWLYAEVARIGLGIPFADRHHVIGLEDSGAGVVSLRLAGFTTIGMSGGNIEESGTGVLCHHRCRSFAEVLEIIR